jgi:hypothetical protein
LKLRESSVRQEVCVQGATFLSRGHSWDILEKAPLVPLEWTTRKKLSRRESTGDNLECRPLGDAFDRSSRPVVHSARQHVPKDGLPSVEFLLRTLPGCLVLVFLAGRERFGNLESREARIQACCLCIRIRILVTSYHVATRKMDPGAGFEPAPSRSRAECSATELPRTVCLMGLTESIDDVGILQVRFAASNVLIGVILV